MRLRLVLAVFGSVLLHTLMLGLLPWLDGSKLAYAPLRREATSRLQVRVLPQVLPAAASLAEPNPNIEVQPQGRPKQNQANPSLATVPPKSTMAATNPLLSSDPIGEQTPSGATTLQANANPSEAIGQRGTGTPLNLTIPVTKLQPRTTLQTLIEKQAMRPDPMAKTFEWVLRQTPPVATEVTTTLDSAGNSATKVRTPWSTYCIGSNMAQGATLYELKSYSGNCP